MSFIEVTFVAGLMVTVAAIAVPELASGLEAIRTRAAVRYLAGRLQKVRTEAVTRSAHVAVKFTKRQDTYVYAVFLDGNGDGVRSRDIDAGIDPPIAPEERLSDHFHGVEFGALPGLPPVDPAATPPGDDPVRIGSSDLLAFTALGTATPGSLYVRSGDRQYVVRILGETGRTRILEFKRHQRTWSPL